MPWYTAGIQQNLYTPSGTLVGFHILDFINETVCTYFCKPSQNSKKQTPQLHNFHVFFPIDVTYPKGPTKPPYLAAFLISAQGFQGFALELPSTKRGGRRGLGILGRRHGVGPMDCLDDVYMSKLLPEDERSEEKWVGMKKPMEKWNDNESGGVVSFLSGNL